MRWPFVLRKTLEKAISAKGHELQQIDLSHNLQLRELIKELEKEREANKKFVEMAMGVRVSKHPHYYEFSLRFSNEYHYYDNEFTKAVMAREMGKRVENEILHSHFVKEP